MSELHTLRRDESGHWYCIRVADLAEFERLRAAVEDGEATDAELRAWQDRYIPCLLDYTLAHYGFRDFQKLA